jgi:prepilin-type N-terminal cleavage/methylation domain-containing protein
MRRGFTLVELLVVIMIIAILMGLLLSGISLVKRKAMETETLHRLEGLRTAVDLYLVENPLLAQLPGAVGTYRVDDYFHRFRLTLGDQYQERLLALAYDESGTGVGPFQAGVHPDRATHVLDAFGWPIEMQITNEYLPGLEASGRCHTREVVIRSNYGTVDPFTRDDLAFIWNLEVRNWRPARIIAVDEDAHQFTAETKE